MDGGAQSPKETWLRLLLIDAGYPRPTTQVPVIDGWGRTFAYLDMGWDDVMIAVEYDGDQHRTDRIRYAWDVKRLRRVRQIGWHHVKVIAEDSASRHPRPGRSGLGLAPRQRWWSLRGDRNDSERNLGGRQPG